MCKCLHVTNSFWDQCRVGRFRAVSLWLATIRWTKSLLRNDVFLTGIQLFRVLLEDFAQSTSQWNRIPCSCPEDVIYHPDAQLSKASFVWTTRNFRPNLPLCLEASNCSSFHPSGRFSSMSGCHLVFDQLWDFFANTDMGRQLQPSGWCGFPLGHAHP